MQFDEFDPEWCVKWFEVCWWKMQKTWLWKVNHSNIKAIDYDAIDGATIFGINGIVHLIGGKWNQKQIK